jgi:hypothetical protein
MTDCLILRHVPKPVTPVLLNSFECEDHYYKRPQPQPVGQARA